MLFTQLKRRQGCMEIYAKSGQKLQWPMLLMIVVIGFCMWCNRISPTFDVVLFRKRQQLVVLLMVLPMPMPMPVRHPFWAAIRGCPAHHLHGHRLPHCQHTGAPHADGKNTGNWRAKYANYLPLCRKQDGGSILGECSRGQIAATVGTPHTVDTGCRIVAAAG